LGWIPQGPGWDRRHPKIGLRDDRALLTGISTLDGRMTEISSLASPNSIAIILWLDGPTTET